MVNAASVRAVLSSDWTKIRTVRSTVWTLLSTFVVSVGLSPLIGYSIGPTLDRLPPQQRESHALFAGFYSLTLGQLALVVFGVLVVSGEYSSGTIRASLMAVPRRGLFYGCQVLAVALLVIGVALVTVPVSFVTAQAGLGPHRLRIDSPGVPAIVVGACLYLTLICLFAMGVATMLRSSTLSLAILLPLLFLNSQGLGNIPKVKNVAQYLPDQAGEVIMHLVGPPGDPRFGRDYGPSTGLAILVLWTVAALIGGCLVLRRRDA
jgi:ABC-2 type transport system permease protein